MTMVKRLSVLVALLSGERVWSFTSSVVLRDVGAPVSRKTHEDVSPIDFGIPNGLRETMLSSSQAFSRRIWLVDNSGSMGMMDGHCQVLPSNKYEDCTRWEELQETVFCHAQLSAKLGLPTDFRLLNPPPNGGPRSFRVGDKSSGVFGTRRQKALRDTKRAQAIMNRNKPSGSTPLHASIKEIRSEIVEMLPQLKADGMKVSVVIVTDGCNHDKNNVGSGIGEAERNQELIEALESLQGLPVWVVIRLCTDYGEIVDFYNGLDERLELSIDVLDDFNAEAEQVYMHNSWLNYAIILHRMREMGQNSQLFDLMDERPFTREEIRDFCILLFGERDLPDPRSDWPGFIAEVDCLQQAERWHWNPRKQALTPWIDVEELALLE